MIQCKNNLTLPLKDLISLEFGKENLNLYFIPLKLQVERIFRPYLIFISPKN